MSSDSEKKWFTVQVRSNKENKAVESLKMLIDLEDMGDVLSKEDILMPTETVSEIKNGKKTQRERKLYPGYIFVKMKLYDDSEPPNLLEKGYYFVKRANGVIDFMGGESPLGPRPQPLRQREIDEIFAQIERAKNSVRPKVDFAVGEHIKITDGPFLNLTGVVEEVDAEKGKLKASVSIFGRFTPVELEFSQAAKLEE